MSDTLDLLRQHRMAFVHDDEAFEALAVLVKLGSATEAQIASELNLRAPDASYLLRRLFRAQVVSVKNDWYSLNTIGADIAFHYGLLGLATREYLNLLDLDSVEKDFLFACADLHDTVRQDYSETVLRHLRSLFALQHYQVLDEHDITSLGRRVTFAIMTGFDPDLHRFGADRYCDLIIHSPNANALSKTLGHTDRKRALKVSCESAWSDARLSDEVLYFKHSFRHVGETESKDEALALTLVRLLTDLTSVSKQMVSGYLDYDIHTSWTEIAVWRPAVTQRLIAVFKEIGIEGAPPQLGSSDMEHFFESVLERATKEQPDLARGSISINVRRLLPKPAQVDGRPSQGDRDSK
jgi:hypothetical protein